jgi:hypothetical protein
VGYARWIWFLYEWLIGIRLDLPDTAEAAYIDSFPVGL